MVDAELEQFKTGVNLSEFAASWGYVLDRRESSRNSAVMRHPNGDKIVIAKNEASGHWEYFSVHTGQDKGGTIIDFVQYRDRVTLGKVRQTLRAWFGTSRPALPLSSYVANLLPVSRDRAAVLKTWEQAKDCFDLTYLTSRGLGPDVLLLPRFAGCVRVDERNNALFPHYDKTGLCGFEVKNKDFTGFAAGGVKGLWHSKVSPIDLQLVFVESAIDAFSYHVLHPDNLWMRYMSTGGTLNPQQPALIRSAIEKLPPDAVVLLAFDNDEGGEKLVQEIKAIAPADRELQRMIPATGKDWNEMLKDWLGLL